MYGANSDPIPHIMHTRVICRIVERSSRHIWSQITPIDVHFVCASLKHRQMTVSYGSGMLMKYAVTGSLSTLCDLSSRIGKFGQGSDGGGEKPWAPIIH